MWRYIVFFSSMASTYALGPRGGGRSSDTQLGRLVIASRVPQNAVVAWSSCVSEETHKRSWDAVEA